MSENISYEVELTFNRLVNYEKQLDSTLLDSLERNLNIIRSGHGSYLQPNEEVKIKFPKNLAQTAIKKIQEQPEEKILVLDLVENFSDVYCMLTGYMSRLELDKEDIFCLEHERVSWKPNEDDLFIGETYNLTSKTNLAQLIAEHADINDVVKYKVTNQKEKALAVLTKWEEERNVIQNKGKGSFYQIKDAISFEYFKHINDLLKK